MERKNINRGYKKLQVWNDSIGSCGEFHSDCCAFLASGHISNDQFEHLDQLHFKIENYLINLIASLQEKQKSGTWEDTFQSHP